MADINKDPINEEIYKDTISKKFVRNTIYIVGLIMIVVVVIYSLPKITTNKAEQEKKAIAEQRLKAAGGDLPNVQALESNLEDQQKEKKKKQDAELAALADAKRNTGIDPNNFPSLPLPPPLPQNQQPGLATKLLPDSMQQQIDTAAYAKRKEALHDHGPLLAINDGSSASAVSVNTGPNGASISINAGNADLQNLLAQNQGGAEKTASAAVKANQENVAKMVEQAKNASQAKQVETTRDEEWLKNQRAAALQAEGAVIHPAPAISKYALMQGSQIPCVLLTAINSQLPGPVQCMVYENVYDSSTQTILLIPKGSRMNGVYNSALENQERVMMGFSRLIYPRGASVNVGIFQAVDSQGRSGVDATTNSQFFKRYGANFLMAGLSWLGDKLTRQNGNNNVTVVSGGSGNLAGASADILRNTSSDILQRNANAPTSLEIPAGTKFNITVMTDMVLPPSITSASAKHD